MSFNVQEFWNFSKYFMPQFLAISFIVVLLAWLISQASISEHKKKMSKIVLVTYLTGCFCLLVMLVYTYIDTSYESVPVSLVYQLGFWKSAMAITIMFYVSLIFTIIFHFPFEKVKYYVFLLATFFALVYTCMFYLFHQLSQLALSQ